MKANKLILLSLIILGFSIKPAHGIVSSIQAFAKPVVAVASAPAQLIHGMSSGMLTLANKSADFCINACTTFKVSQDQGAMIGGAVLAGAMGLTIVKDTYDFFFTPNRSHGNKTNFDVAKDYLKWATRVFVLGASAYYLLTVPSVVSQ